MARRVNICRYKVKPGKEEEMVELLEKHWPALREAGLATDDPPIIYRGVPGDRHGAGGVFIEIFSWKADNGPQLAHETPGVMAVWEPMGAICEQMEFPMFDTLDLFASA
jgi:hypothetical protein